MGAAGASILYFAKLKIISCCQVNLVAGCRTLDGHFRTRKYLLPGKSFEPMILILLCKFENPSGFLEMGWVFGEWPAQRSDLPDRSSVRQSIPSRACLTASWSSLTEKPDKHCDECYDNR